MSRKTEKLVVEIPEYDGPFCPSCGCSVGECRWFYVGKPYGRTGGPPKPFVPKVRAKGKRKPSDTCMECARKVASKKTVEQRQRHCKPATPTGRGRDLPLAAAVIEQQEKKAAESAKKLAHKAICKWEITYDHLDGRNVLVQSVGFEADEGDEWTEFKLYDGDGELYYSGRKNQHGDGFEPLDDYGQPNAGATELRYLDKNSNTWKVL